MAGQWDDVRQFKAAPYVVEYDVPANGLPAVDPLQFKGLLLFELLNAPAGKSRLQTYWADRASFDVQKDRFKNSFGLDAPLFEAYATTQTWKPSRKRFAWLAAAAAAITAGGVVWALVQTLLWPADPRVDAIIDRRDVRMNDRFEAGFTIGNLSRTSATVEIESAVRADDVKAEYATRWHKAYLGQGEYRDNQVSGRISKAGDFIIKVHGTMKAGLIPPSEPFDLKLQVKVWSNGITTTEVAATDADTTAGTCTFVAFVEAGVTTKGRLSCDATMAPAADLRFALDSVSAAGLRSSVPRPPILTPGSESHTDDLELNPMNEFTRRRLRLRLKGSVHRSVAECAAFASHLKIECIDKEKQ